MLLPLALGLAGAASHVIYFNRDEHHMYALRYIQLTFSLYSVCSFVVYFTHSSRLDQALQVAAGLAISFFVGLYLSLLYYRLVSHPLRRFPGPISLKISSLCLSAHLFRLDAHSKVAAMHERYGEFVRVGSSDLSITHPLAPEVIYGRRSKCQKADWYDLTLPMVSMQTTRQRSEHDQRRRTWGRAFNDTILLDYEKRIALYQDQLSTRLSSAHITAVNVTQLFHQFAFDLMGDLSFGTSFHMLQNKGNHWAIKLLRRGMEPLGLMFPTWCFRLLLSIPGATGDWFAFKDYCCKLLDDRIKTDVAHSNIMSFLLEPWYAGSSSLKDLNMLQGDSQLIIVAGSDTTASTLACVFYELLRHPEVVITLRKELATLPRPLTNESLQTVGYLTGIINEALRLHSPAGLALQRKTPPEGLFIGDTYVPGAMTVWCPQYIIGKSSKVYTDPLEFLPERWTTKAHLVKQSSAFAPFSLGAYNCIGKPLAMLILRTSIARIVTEFEFEYGPGETGRVFLQEARTNFITQPGNLELLFRRVATKVDKL